MYKHYKLLGIIAVFVIVVFLGTLLVSDLYSQYVDRGNYEKFLQGNAFYTPQKNGLPYEVDVVYNQIHELSPKNNLILVGASTTREGVLPDQLSLSDNWTLHNFGIGSDTIFSYKVMRNYLNRYANHTPDKSDVVVIHIFYASFVEQPHDTNYLKQIIEKTGTYRVDSTGNVTGEMTYPYRVWELDNYKIYSLSNALWNGEDSVKAHFFALIRQVIQQPVTLGSAANSNGTCVNSSCDEKLNEYRQIWTTYTQNASYPGNSTTEFKELLKQLNNQTHVVVVNLYVPSWQRSYPKEQEYERWTQSDLVPFLRENNIQWEDYSTAIPDSEYGDSAHLFRQGRIEYTKRFNNDFNMILANISNK